MDLRKTLPNGPCASTLPHFANLVVGQICGYVDEVSKKSQVRTMNNHNYYPVANITAGSFFKKQRDACPDPVIKKQIKGFILSFGYNLTYYE